LKTLLHVVHSTQWDHAQYFEYESEDQQTVNGPHPARCQQQKIYLADQRIGHQIEIAYDQSGHPHVTSCPRIVHPYVSRAHAASAENKDQNIQVQATSTVLAAKEVEEEAFAEPDAPQAEQQNHLHELPHH
jgi:hypothetical protein